VREELRPYEGQYVLVRGLLKETTHHVVDRYDCLFVSCVWKPVALEGRDDIPLAEVPAHTTDHLWVRVPVETLNEWRRENPTSLLLKRLEKVFRVERYQRADGSEDFGLVLPEELDCRLVSSLFGRLKAFRRDHEKRKLKSGAEVAALFQELLKDLSSNSGKNFFLYTPLDSTLSTNEAYDRFCNELTAFGQTFLVKQKARMGVNTFKELRTKGRKVKQKQGPKPARGF
jgi:hypothetical protein